MSKWPKSAFYDSSTRERRYAEYRATLTFRVTSAIKSIVSSAIIETLMFRRTVAWRHDALAAKKFLDVQILAG